MPKLKKFKPVEVEEREAELRKRYGGMMSSADVSEELGRVDPKTVRKWLSGIVGVNVNGRLRFRAIVSDDHIPVILTAHRRHFCVTRNLNLRHFLRPQSADSVKQYPDSRPHHFVFLQDRPPRLEISGHGNRCIHGLRFRYGKSHRRLPYH